MEITYVVIITIVTYIIGAITKMFVNAVPSKYLPMQNVIIGVVSGLICYFAKVEPNLLQALCLCLIASMGAGGLADLSKLKEDE